MEDPGALGLTPREDRIAAYIHDVGQELRGLGPLPKSKAVRLTMYAGELLCNLQAERLKDSGMMGR
jgi:hypothetical protein